MRVLFVCTGNVCRGPIAEAIFRQKIGKKSIEVRSAGMHAFDGDPISPKAETILTEHGINYSQKSQRLNLELLEWADLILTMTRRQKYMIMARYTGFPDKIYTIKEFVGMEDLNDISNPFGKDLNSYRYFAWEIEQLLNLLYEKLFCISFFREIRMELGVRS